MLVFITINFTTIIKKREQLAQKEGTVWKGTVYTVVTHEQKKKKITGEMCQKLILLYTENLLTCLCLRK